MLTGVGIVAAGAVPVLAAVFVPDGVEPAFDDELLPLVEFPVPLAEDVTPDPPVTEVETEGPVPVDPVLAPPVEEAVDATPVEAVLVPVFMLVVVFVSLAVAEAPLPGVELVVPAVVVVVVPENGSGLVPLVGGVFVEPAMFPLLAVVAESLLAGVEVEAVVPPPIDVVVGPELLPVVMVADGAALLPEGDTPLAVLLAPEVTPEEVLTPLADVPAVLVLNVEVEEPVDAVPIPAEDVPAFVLLPDVVFVPVAVVLPA